MSNSRAAAGLDRLPWLADEPKPLTRNAKHDRAAWTAAGALIVAGLVIWIPWRMGTEDAEQSRPLNTAPPAATVTLPAPRPAPSQDLRIEPQPQVSTTRAPEVRPAPVREVRIAPPPARKVVRERSLERRPMAVRSSRRVERQAVAPAPVIVRTVPRAAPLRPWPPRVTAGAAGRLVQIGAYGSRYQAKRGWWSMVRAYPAMRRLPAVVVVTRNSRGRIFYRFQVGTTSQAHSEVMCQRMDTIDLSCAVVGLPWRSKVER